MSIPDKLNHLAGLAQRADSYSARLYSVTATLGGQFPNEPAKGPGATMPTDAEQDHHLARFEQLNRALVLTLDRIEGSLEMLSAHINGQSPDIASKASYDTSRDPRRL